MLENPGSWEQCGMFVLQELKRMNNLLEKLDNKINNLNLKVAGIAATVGILVTLIMNFVMGAIR